MSSRTRPKQGGPQRRVWFAFSFLLLLIAAAVSCESARRPEESIREVSPDQRVQLGPRPFYLIDQMAAGPLRDRLESCRAGPFHSTTFSIGHRGAPLQFPEHTEASYRAAARMGAGVIECDVTFTRDRELVCRHSQCDLATTTNILETPLAQRCSQSFRPATFHSVSGELLQKAEARCCTSDLTLGEFRQLEARMDAENPRAQTVSEYLDATPRWRTDLYTNGQTVLSHDESLELFLKMGVDMTPELKAAAVEMPFEGDYSQERYAKQLLEAYQKAGIPADRVQFQTFDPDDIRFWLSEAPDYGARAIWLVERSPDAATPPLSEFERLFDEGFRTIAPPISTLLRIGEDGAFEATAYAERARAAGLEIIAWSFERSGRIRNHQVEGRSQDFYLGPLLPQLLGDGDLFSVIDALVNRVGVRAVFSDWPATTTYYANCFGLE